VHHRLNQLGMQVMCDLHEILVCPWCGGSEPPGWGPRARGAPVSGWAGGRDTWSSTWGLSRTIAGCGHASRSPSGDRGGGWIRTCVQGAGHGDSLRPSNCDRVAAMVRGRTISLAIALPVINRPVASQITCNCNFFANMGLRIKNF